MKLGFIGTGVMGASLVRHLLKADHTVHIHTRTRAKAEPLLGDGAHWAETPGDAASQAEMIFTMVGFPSDVEEVYLGDQGILQSAPKDALLVDLTTSTPTMATKIAREAATKNLHALDAPVSGGDVGAREGRLVIMVGGEEADFQRALPLLQVFGQNIRRHGPAGAGQHAKMANQVAVAATMLGWCEALGYAQRANLDPEAVLASISGGAAGSWTMQNLAPRALRGDFAAGFYIKHIVKDLGIALDAAKEMNLDLPGLALANQLYTRLRDQGHGDEGTQALFRLFAGK